MASKKNENLPIFIKKYFNHRYELFDNLQTMIINNNNRNNVLEHRKFVVSGLLTLFLLVSSVSISQTSEDEKNFQQCKACHTIGGGKLVGPDLKGITARRDEAWLISFIQSSQKMIQSGDEQAVKVFNDNLNIPMPDNNLTDDQVKGILLFIDNDGKLAEGEIAEAGIQADSATAVHSDKDFAELIVEMKRDETRNMRSVFVIMVLLIIISITDLILFKIVKAKWIHYVIVLIAVIIVSEIVVVEAIGLGRQQYYQPDQPIQFSHKVHAGQNQIDCQYCHYTANTSMHAGIPPVETCMNCHKLVKEGKQTGTKEIAKIYTAIENNKPIEWVKVYNLPDHVYFNHAQHVAVGKMDCAKCHGEVNQMDQIIQESNLSMGWCIECHRTESVQFVSNKFFEQYTKLHEKLKSGEITDVTVQNIGGDECAKCHY